MASAAADGVNVSTESDERSQNLKRARADDENGGEDGKESQSILSGFKTPSVLSDSAREKIIFIHGKVFFLKS